MLNVSRVPDGFFSGSKTVVTNALQSLSPATTSYSLAAMKAEEPVVSADILRLQGEEASLAQQLSTEQGRWSDINRGLEELERALARKP